MKPCRECQREISEQALACPGCGAPYPARARFDGFGFEYRSSLTVAGLPLVHVSFKFRPNPSHRARAGYGAPHPGQARACSEISRWHSRHGFMPSSLPRAGCLGARAGRRAGYRLVGFQRASAAPVGSTITLNQPTPGTSVASFMTFAPRDFAFWVAAPMSSTST